MSFQPMQLGALRQIAMTVSDIERSVAFYRDRLGLTLLFAMDTMAFFDLNGVRLMLGLPEGATAEHYASILYFRSSDIVGDARTLGERGVLFERAPELVAKMPDHELWIGFFRDPDRNLLALMEERRP